MRDQEVGLALLGTSAQVEPLDAGVAGELAGKLVAKRLVELLFSAALHRQHRSGDHAGHGVHRILPSRAGSPHDRRDTGDREGRDGGEQRVFGKHRAQP